MLLCNMPTQTSVITVNQPLFAKIKQLQWSMVNLYGEDKFVLLLGGLHTETTANKVLGHWLEGSGWEEAVQEICESFLKASYVTRTRHAHQVAASALHILQKKSYDVFVESLSQCPPESFSFWCTRRKDKHPKFFYWHTTLELWLLMLAFVHSLRIGDF